MVSSTDGSSSGPHIFGLLDAWVVGKVANASGSLDIECECVYVGGTDPVVRTYTGTSDELGNFNITVDSNTWGDDVIYSPITVKVLDNYYQSTVAGKEQYLFENATYMGNVTLVPQGSLEVMEEPLSNLTLKILNGSSQQPLEGVRIELEYPPSFPDPPFSMVRATDPSGDALYEGIRSVNTTVNATKLHFLPLGESDEMNYVIVQEGGDMQRTFTMTENPWPFRLVGDKNDINASKNLTVDFRMEMDTVSMTTLSNYQLMKLDGMVPIGISLSSKDGSTKAIIDPIDDLEYDTQYRLRLEPYLRSDSGTFPLWRAMEIDFKTELPPGDLSGRVINSQDGSPGEGIRIQILDQIRITNSTGHFFFSVVPQGTYRVDILESFLYNDTVLNDVSIVKGQSLDLGDIEIDPKPWGSLEVNIMSGDVPLEGAWVRIVDDTIVMDSMNMTTDAGGRAFFPNVKTGAVIVKMGADHHSQRDDMALVYEAQTAVLNADLVEDEIPVWLEATDVNVDGSVDPQTNILVNVPEPIVFSSLNVTMWKLDDDGEPLEMIDLTPPEKQTDLIYVINPPRLDMETQFRVMVGSELLSSGSGEEVIWRDVYLDIRTPDYALSYVNGSLLFEGEVYVGFEVVFGDFSDMVDDEGAFNITIDLSDETLQGSLLINGSSYGYGSFEMDLDIAPGNVYEAGNIDLYHIENWYVIDPQAGSQNVESGSSITAMFLRPFQVPGPGNWSRVFSVIPEGSSAPISGTYTVSAGNTTVTFVPGTLLSSDTEYTVRISSDLLQESGTPMFPIGNKTVFKTEPPEIHILLESPSEDDLGSVDLDEPLVFVFSSAVKKEIVENAFDFDPLPSSVAFNWPTSTRLEIHLLMGSSTEYTVSLPPGKYGINDDPLKTALQLVFTTSSQYGSEHNLGSVQASPSVEGGWETGQQVKFSGTALDASGWTVNLLIEKDGTTIGEEEVLVGEDGAWVINFTSPSDPGEYSLTLTVGVPEGPAADTWSGTVEVKDQMSAVDDDGGDDGNTMIIALAIIAVIILIIVAAFIYAANQRKKAQEEIDGIEYDDVESEWDNDEE